MMLCVCKTLYQIQGLGKNNVITNPNQSKPNSDRLQSHVDFCYLYVNIINHPYSSSKACI